jgi:hypothetical protein
VIAFIDHELGGFAQKFVAGQRGVMEAYVLLQVIEERGVAQYPVFAAALDRYDPESAAVVREVVGDEERHIKYAKAISKRYAPNPIVLDATVREFRAAEQRAFERHGRAFLAAAVDGRVLAVGSIEQLAWQLLASLGGRPKVPAFAPAAAFT